MSTFREDLDMLKDETYATFKSSETAIAKEERELVEHESENESPLEIITNETDEGRRSESPKEFQEKARGTPKKQTIDRNQRRINEITYRAKLSEEQNMQLAARAQEDARRIASLTNELAHQKKIANQYFDNNQQLTELQLSEALKEAKMVGDVDGEVSIQRQMAKLQAERSTFDLYKYQQAQQDAAQAPYNDSDVVEYPISQLPPISSYNYENAEQSSEEETLSNWLADNPWADEGDPNYDEGLVNEAMQYKSVIDKQLKLERKAHLIGSKEYLDTISNVIRNNYLGEQEETQAPSNNNFESQEDSHPIPQHNYQTRAAVAPVYHSGGSSMAEQYATSQRHNASITPLKPDQYNAIRDLAQTTGKPEQEIAQRFKHTVDAFKEAPLRTKFVTRG